MNPSVALVVALLLLTALLALLTLAMAARKALRQVADRRRADLEARLRPAVLAMLAQDEPDLSALPVLGRGGGPVLVEVVTGLLRKLRGEDRAVLVRLLEGRGVLEAARRRTYRPGALGRARAAALLGTAGVQRALPELARLLRDRDPEVRAVAARALGKLGDPGATPFLLAALEEPRPLPASLVSMALLHIGPPAAEPLRAGLGSPAANARTVSLELLGLFGLTPAADDIVATLRSDPAPEVRVAAARALGRIGSPRPVPALAACLGVDRPAALRAAAATALGAIGDPGAAPALEQGLVTRNTVVVRACAGALARLGPDGVAVLERAAARAGRAGPYADEALATVAPAAAGRAPAWT